MTDKEAAALKALEFLPLGGVLGIGSGSTVFAFIDQLAPYREQLRGVVAASLASEERLKKAGFSLLDPNSTSIDVYIDGTDEANPLKQLIKGQGGALTREKILASISDRFIVMMEGKKYHTALGQVPLAVEVHPMARSFVSRALTALGGKPQYRAGYLTDNGYPIIDVSALSFHQPLALEKELNNIPGVISHGLFAHRPADCLIVAQNLCCSLY